MEPIPVASPGAAYRVRRTEIDVAVRRVLDSGWYIMGSEVAAFEREFAEFVGASRCVTAATGTDAIVLILKAMGIGPGDTVATVSHTAVASVSAVEQAGAHPLLVDVDEHDFTMSPDHLEAALASWTGPPVRVVLPVHLYGRPADMDPILEISARHGAAVVEDCAQAHGASYRGRSVGTMGRAAAFSFYPTKNLGALGDGGAVVTSDPEIDGRCRLLKQYGWERRYVSEVAGMNSRLDEIQAAVLRVKLRHLPADNERRRAIAAVYRRAEGARVKHPRETPGLVHVYHQYVIQTGERASLQEHCERAGIGTAILYPVPVHRQPAYEGRVSLGPGGVGITERIADRILSLPVWPELTDGQSDVIADALRAF